MIVESGILGFGIRNPSQGIIRDPANDWNPESPAPLTRIRNTPPGIQNLQRGMEHPRLSWFTLHGLLLFSHTA